MIEVSVHELNKYYGSNHVLKNISLDIYRGEKIGLLGKNGSGKTTLFKIISEDENYDSGSLSIASGRKVEILDQIPDFGETETVEQILYSSFKEITQVLEAMKKIEKPVTKSKKLTEDFISGGYAAKQLVSLDSVYKSYGDNKLMDNITLTINRNDSIALIGANGCGKTTLLRLIMGDEESDGGIVKVSSNVKIVYMPQIIRFDDENATILETLRNITGLPEEKNRAILAGFRFRAVDVSKKVGNLSGGERSRLKLCLLMQNKANFLILDEPTNHLDIESREWIEEAVTDFDGTKLFISHDRYFLNKFATRVWSMRDGGITDFPGGFDEFLEFMAGATKKTSRLDEPLSTK